MTSGDDLMITRRYRPGRIMPNLPLGWLADYSLIGEKVDSPRFPAPTVFSLQCALRCVHGLAGGKQRQQAETVQQAQLRGIEVGLLVQVGAGRQRGAQPSGKGRIERAHTGTAGAGVGQQFRRAVAQRADDADAADRYAPHAARQRRSLSTNRAH